MALITALGDCTVGALPSESDLGREYFENHIRPLLATKCLQCHSRKERKSGLSLEYRQDWVRGGKRGRAIRPGQPDRSLLIQVVRGEHDDLSMPQKGDALTKEQVGRLVEWVQLGAYDPRKPSQKFQRPSVSPDIVSKHWAFQPIKRPRLPQVRNQAWLLTPVDSFVLRRLEQARREHSRLADARTRVRRVYFDVLGLPPTYDAVSRFRQSGDPDAWGKLVDRLLDDPRYGERWGRHWLDVARYADTAGYRAVGQQRRFPYSYTYRDYVIEAFNRDLPFDQFVREQLAADFLVTEQNRSSLAAMGFLTLGRAFLDDKQLEIEDRIDVVTRGLMGLTVQCARCHDHKYDPIPTADYYSLYGVFENSRVSRNLPLLPRETPADLLASYEAEKRSRELAYTNRFAAEVELAHHRIRSATGNYLLGVHRMPPSTNDKQRDRYLQERKLVPVIFRQWREFLKAEHHQNHSVLQPWFELTRNQPISPINNAAVAKAFKGVASVSEAARVFNDLFRECDTVEVQTDPAKEEIRKFIRASDSPATAPDSEHWNLVQLVREPLNELRARIAELDGEHPGAPARAMTMEDNPRLRESVIFERGNPNLRGVQVPRQFLKIASGGERKPFRDGSGRRELADAIVDPRNPLTARVFVNRLWMHHFGRPLVDTPGDFGVRAEPPTHPQLLEWLAVEFIDSGWSIKHLHRLILKSATYQQSSYSQGDTADLDPENRLYGHMNLRRLELEPVRDSMLFVTGQLDQRQGGLAAPMFTNVFNARRTVYGFVDRAALPSFLRDFDLASPDVSADRRIETSVPQQSLFLMNSSFVRELAKRTIRSPQFEKRNLEERVNWLWRRFFQRPPRRRDVAEAMRFIDGPESSEPYHGPVGWQYGTGDFDSASGRIYEFQHFDHLVQDNWQAAKTLPDERLGFARLEGGGGHASRSDRRVVIRRWTAPANGVVSIRGQVAHRVMEGDGIKAFVVSSRAGVMGRWLVHRKAAPTVFDDIPVALGESIDFICHKNGTEDHDRFIWIPVVEYTRLQPRPGQGEVMQLWRAKADFKKQFAPIPRPPTKWEQYVQTLLQANELHFVD